MYEHFSYPVWYVLIMKPNWCTNFSNLFLEWNSTGFGQFLCPSSVVFHCTHNNCICHTGLLTACGQDQDGTAKAATSWSCPQAVTAVPSWSHMQAVTKPVWHIPLLCVQWKTTDDGQRNCPKHVEYHSKNKFEKLVHLYILLKEFITMHGHMKVLLIWYVPHMVRWLEY